MADIHRYLLHMLADNSEDTKIWEEAVAYVVRELEAAKANGEEIDPEKKEVDMSIKLPFNDPLEELKNIVDDMYI